MSFSNYFIFIKEIHLQLLYLLPLSRVGFGPAGHLVLGFWVLDPQPGHIPVKRDVLHGEPQGVSCQRSEKVTPVLRIPAAF